MVFFFFPKVQAVKEEERFFIFFFPPRKNKKKNDKTYGPLRAGVITGGPSVGAEEKKRVSTEWAATH